MLHGRLMRGAALALALAGITLTSEAVASVSADFSTFSESRGLHTEAHPGNVRAISLSANADADTDKAAETEASGSGDGSAADVDTGYLSELVTEEAFATLFPKASSLYSYRALGAAASTLYDGAFLAQGAATSKLELAAFLAHVAMATNDLQLTQDMTMRAGVTSDEAAVATASEGGDIALYCDHTYASCARGKSYHGRGPLMLRGNAEYARCSMAIGRRDTLVTSPELVSTDSHVAWASAIWQWMKDDGLGSLHDAVVGETKGGFARTTAMLKGGAECGATPLSWNGDGSRVLKFTTIATALEVPLSEKMTNALSCMTVVPAVETPAPETDTEAEEEAGDLTADSPIAALMPKKTFEKLFKDAISLYSYESLLEAAALYSAFATGSSGADGAEKEDQEANKAELAAFLAHVSVKTKALTLREDESYVKYGDDVFCNTKKAECVDGRSYHGRGALMTEWNFVYDSMGASLGVDLVKNPDDVARKSDVAWKTGLFVWMTDVGQGRPHDYAGTTELMAQATSILYGTRRCGDSPTDKDGDDTLVAAYQEIAKALGLADDSPFRSDRTLTCRRLQYGIASASGTRSLGDVIVAGGRVATVVETLLTEDQFSKLYPHANAFYSYRALVEASRYYPLFANEEGDVYNQRELSAFLAHASVYSGNFTRREMPNAAFYDADAFCDTAVAACAAGKRYHARGAFPMRWNYNYLKCGDFLALDLLSNPDLVRLDSTVAWRAALWFWMEQKPLSPLGSLHSVMHQHLDSPDDNFKLSTQMLAIAADGTDSQMCGGSDSEKQRIAQFIAVCRELGVPITDSEEKRKQLQCKPQYDGPRASTTASGDAKTPLRDLVSSSQFQQIVPPSSANLIYGYEAFVGAALVFPGFAGSADPDVSRREVAALLAHASFVTDGFTLVQDDRAAAACTTAPLCYHGRGPLMMTGKSVYERFEAATRQPVVASPDDVASSADLAWQTAFYLWTTNKVAADEKEGADDHKIEPDENRDNALEIQQTAHEYSFTDYAFAGSCTVITPELCPSSSASKKNDGKKKKNDDDAASKPSDSGATESTRRRLIRQAGGDMDADALAKLMQLYEQACEALEVEPEEVLSCQDSKFTEFQVEQLESESDGGAAAITKFLPKELFQELFPNADPLYSYHTLIDATKKFPTFVNDGPEVQNRYEMAAFLAQMAHASGNFTYTQQSGYNLFPVDQFCDKTITTAACAPNERYHGRGPIQLSWNYNYDKYGKYLDLDLLNYPNWVATDSKIAWGSAIWYWMTAFSDMGSMHDVFPRGTKEGGGVYDYAYTTFLLIGSLECGAEPVVPEPETQRISLMKLFATRFGVSPGPKLSCQNGDYEYPTY